LQAAWQWFVVELEVELLLMQSAFSIAVLKQGKQTTFDPSPLHFVEGIFNQLHVHF